MEKNTIKEEKGKRPKKRLTDIAILKKLLKEGTEEQKRVLSNMIKAYRDRKELQKVTKVFDKISSELEAKKLLLLNNGYSESDIAKLMEDARNNKIILEEKPNN